MQSIRGSTVTAQDGSKIDLKRIKTVPADSTDAQGRFAQNTAGPERKRRDVGPIIVALQEELDGRTTPLSLTKASELLRQRMRLETQSYDAVLTKAKAKLVDIIRLAPETFKLTVQQRTGDKEYHYVSLRERT